MDNWLARVCESASREVRSWPTPLQLATPSARWEWSKRVARLKAEYPSLARQIEAVPEEAYKGGRAVELMRAEWQAHVAEHSQVVEP